MSAEFDPLCLAVQSANRQYQQLNIRGGGSHQNIGFSTNKDAINVDIKYWNKINFYSPGELVLSAQAGANIAELSALLAEKKQRFSCSFRNLSGLYGSDPTASSLGGGLSVGISGSDRVNHYAVRDAVLGLSAVNARGELVVMGGRVFKNVTGYDLTKLMIGSLGTLGIIASVNMRLRPLAETEATICFSVENVSMAGAVMATALNSPFDVCGAYSIQTNAGYDVFLRIDGFANSVQERKDGLLKILKLQNFNWIEDSDSEQFWLNAQNMQDFALRPSTDDIWLLTQPAARVENVLQAVQELMPNAQIRLDWGGAQIWLATEDQCNGKDIRAVVSPYGATVQPIRVSDHRAKGTMAMDAGTQKLTKKLYQEFDPQNIFQRERLYGDMLGAF